MFDKLIDFLIQIGERLLPFWILWDWELGIRVGRGKRKALGPGTHWKCPIFDKVWTCNGKNDTFKVINNNVTTADGKTVTIGGTIGYKVTDVMLWLNENNGAKGNLHDIAWGVIGEFISKSDWESIKKKTIRTDIKNTLKEECAHLGVEIQFVRFGNIVQSRTYNLFNNFKDDDKD